MLNSTVSTEKGSQIQLFKIHKHLWFRSLLSRGSLVASRQCGAYNGSCLGNASLITLIGLISELAAGKCQSGQQKMEKLINGKGERASKTPALGTAAKGAVPRGHRSSGDTVKRNPVAITHMRADSH